VTLAEARKLPLVLTVEHAGRLLGLRRSAAYEAARRGEIPTQRYGRQLLVPTAALLTQLGFDVGRVARSPQRSRRCRDLTSRRGWLAGEAGWSRPERGDSPVPDGEGRDLTRPGLDTNRPLSDLLSIPDPADAAAGYCQAGWSIVPCRVTGKRALVRWKPWQQTPPDAEQLVLWWRRWPRANLAVITGRVSGVVVVDVDLRHGGDRALAELESRHGDLPWSAVVETPGGGWHVYLRHPGGRVPNSAGRIGLGVDVRGDGGLALLPPSRRHGAAYRWALGGPATVPPAWLELLRPTPRPRRPPPGPPLGHGGQQEARLAGLLRVLQRAPEGRRNATLYWAGRRLAEMLDQGAPDHWREVLEQAGLAAGLEPAEVRATLASALDGAEP